MANLLRANVTNTKDWWELRLLDLKVVADGATEAEMLQQLAYLLTAEYHIALKRNETPFVNIRRETPPIDLEEKWNEGGAKFGVLTLSVDVSNALAMVLGYKHLAPFRIAERAAA